MRETNGHLNAVVVDLGDQALADAAAADKALADGSAPGPMQGVPITIKVNADQEGLANTNGVTAFKDLIAPADAPVVTNLKKAGAIVIGRTNTPEFSMRATTTNELHGRTYNPWNDWASSGGSSGGASSAVMAGMGAMAHGNDIGGSLRFPAFCTGAASIKPSFQRVPSHNPSAPAERGIMAQTFSVQGPICRSFADVRRSMQALVAYDPQDPWQVPMPYDGPDEGRPRVVLTKTTYGWDLDPAVSGALDTAASALSDAGYEVVETEPPLLEEIASEAIKMMYGETVEMFSDAIEQHGSQECRDIFSRISQVFDIYRGTELAAGMSRRAKYIRAGRCSWPTIPWSCRRSCPDGPMRGTATPKASKVCARFWRPRPITRFP